MNNLEILKIKLLKLKEHFNKKKDINKTLPIDNVMELFLINYILMAEKTEFCYHDIIKLPKNFSEIIIDVICSSKNPNKFENIFNIDYIYSNEEEFKNIMDVSLRKAMIKHFYHPYHEDQKFIAITKINDENNFYLPIKKINFSPQQIDDLSKSNKDAELLIKDLAFITCKTNPKKSVKIIKAKLKS